LLNLDSNFGPTHPDINDVYLEHFEIVKRHIPSARQVSKKRRLLIGACFTMEYAIESAALFNPSMVPAIDQVGVPPGSIRILILASMERASGLLSQLESWNGSKTQGTLTKEDHDAILQLPAPILLWRGPAHQEDVSVHPRP
jgi:hypothetical protein